MKWSLYPAARLVETAQAWDDLQRRTTDTPFLESGFLLPAIKLFGTGRELLAVCIEANQWQAASIISPEGAGRWVTFQPSQLPLAPWVAAPEFDLAIHSHGLLRALPGFALSLGLTQLDPKLTPRPGSTATREVTEYVKTASLDIEGTFEDYWQLRGKNLRQNVRKQLSKLEKEGLVPRIDVVVDPASVSAAIEQYGALESNGWKAHGGTAVHSGSAQGLFYSEVLRTFCQRGRGRIVRYWFGDEVAAMDLCIDNGSLVVVLKTTYDEAHGQRSPASLMRFEELRDWWEEGRFRRIEFYGKVMEWHTARDPQPR